MDRGAWRLTVHVVAKSWIQLSDWAHEVADHIILMGLTRISSINLIICIIQRLPRTFFITPSKELFIRYRRRKTSLDLGQQKWQQLSWVLKAWSKYRFIVYSQWNSPKMHSYIYSKIFTEHLLCARLSIRIQKHSDEQDRRYLCLHRPRA